MFDTIAETRRFVPQRRLLPIAVSFTAHVLVMIVVAVSALFVLDELPEVATMTAFVAPMPLSPPPPPPPPSPAKPPRARPVTAETRNAAPIEAQTRIEPESGIERDAGVPGGVEGGIPGGVVGGIVGGITEAPPPPPALPPPPPRHPVRVGGGISAPTQLVRVSPVYPEIAARAHIEGLVILEALVDETGEVRETKVIRSVKFLDEAAIDAVKQWRLPLLLNGRPCRSSSP